MMPNFLNMISWWQWLILSAIPPAIIALYFLKLKRQPLEVPSTYLWHKSIEDLHVNSIWQRLRKNLLLLLQLLLILLVMLALLRPNWRTSSLSGDRFIFLIDNSASMSATDVAASRLEEAKRQVTELIEQMKTGDKAMVISFADSAQVVHEFTDNRRALRRRVAEIKPTHEATTLLTALRMAAGLANPGRTASDAGDVATADALPADLFIFSDGNFPNVEGFSLGNLDPTFIPIGQPDVGNVAITAFSTRRHETKADVLQAYGQIENFGGEAVTAAVDLYLDGTLIDADKLTIELGKARGVVFELANTESGVLRLELKTKDPLALDNVAYAALNVPRRGRVLFVSPGNDAIDWALATDRVRELADVEFAEPAVLKTEAYQTKAASGAYDLVIYDRCVPEAMPQANTLFIGRVPPLAAWKPDGKEPEKITAPQIIDTNRTHPLMQFLELGDVDIAESFSLTPPQGGTELIDGGEGKLFVIAPREGVEDAVLGFEIISTNDQGETTANTNWLLRASFPTFIYNVLHYLGGQQSDQAISTTRPGQVVRLRSSTPAKEIEVRTPSGNRHLVPRGKRNEFNFNRADQIGVYEIREGKQLTQRFSVNLFNSAESNIAPRPDGAIQIGYTDVAAEAGFEPTRRELWKVLLLCALGVLILEWYIYNRRVYL